MGNEQEHVTVGEFSRSMQSLQGQIQSGFDGLNTRLDTYGTTQVTQGQDIARLDERTKASGRRAGTMGAGWGALVAAAGALVQYLTGKGGG